MVLGRLAERRFELLVPSLTAGRNVSIEPRLADRSTTDYLLKDGNGNPVCRINIKFHGTLFRDALTNVGLAPDDCFALATYKIHSALERQQQDGFPYVFFVLSIPNLTAASVAESVPADLVWALAVVDGKRIVEEAIADVLRGPEYEHRFQELLLRMGEGQFRIVSARKAANLLKTLLFERVYAIRVPRFVQATQVNMHFSLSTDLAPIEDFLRLIDGPLHILAVRLDRGEL
jgi:hypothetical protein